MALHLLPFVAGAVLGSLATFVYKDEKARKTIKNSTTSVGDKTKKVTNVVSNKMADGLGSLSDKLRTAESGDATVSETEGMPEEGAQTSPT